MKILTFNQFNEKIVFQKRKISDIKNLGEPAIDDNSSNTNSADWHGRKLKDCYDVYSYLNMFNTAKELNKLVAHVELDRFYPWNGKYNMSDLVKQHEKRAISNVLKDKKIIANTYAAFDAYYYKNTLGPGNEKIADKIINAYINRMKTEFNLTTKQVVDMFFYK